MNGEAAVDYLLACLPIAYRTATDLSPSGYKRGTEEERWRHGFSRRGAFKSINSEAVGSERDFVAH